MNTLVSFLRAVNMAGHNKINMTGLTELFESIGFRQSETYIQSGNVIFNNINDLNEDDVASLIENTLKDRFGLTVPAMIRNIDKIKQIISENPFLDEKGFDPAKMAVMFLREKPGEDQIMKVKDVNYPPDKFNISGKEIFVYCPNGFGKTKLYTNFFENKMKIIGTARNWNTVNTILEIAEQKQSHEI
jgi:uncharacterized protein (DUF1697 family)